MGNLKLPYLTMASLAFLLGCSSPFENEPTLSVDVQNAQIEDVVKKGQADIQDSVSDVGKDIDGGLIDSLSIYRREREAVFKKWIRDTLKEFEFADVLLIDSFMYKCPVGKSSDYLRTTVFLRADSSLIQFQRDYDFIDSHRAYSFQDNLVEHLYELVEKEYPDELRGNYLSFRILSVYEEGHFPNFTYHFQHECEYVFIKNANNRQIILKLGWNRGTLYKK